MALQIGIVGLPNVGKSTLFNAITKSASAAAENFPFCTIDPNVGMVEVPDKRIDRLSTIVKPQRVVHSGIEFVDIAGLVKGASTGEGLGNKFLANIRECDAIAMVVRFFEDSNVHHVSGKVSPKEDKEIIELELIMADLQTIEKAKERTQKGMRSGKEEDVIKFQLCEELEKFLEAGNSARNFELKTDEEKIAMRELHLLTQKPELFVVNVSEDEFADFSAEDARKKLGLSENAIIVPVSAKAECDLIDFSEEEAKELMEAMGMKESGLSTLIRSAFSLLNLQSFFTAGVQEVRAWTIAKGTKAPQAAGVIHTDFEKKFIKAEVCSVDDFVQFGGWSGVRDNGKLRLEGKEYTMQESDVVVFKVGN